MRLQRSLAGKRREGAVVRLAPPSRVYSAWLAVLFIVLLAFTWQSFLAQTHQHFQARWVPATVSAAPDQSGVQSPAKQSSSDDPVDCPICRAIAHAGNYLPSAPVVLVVPVSADLWRTVSPLPCLPVVRQLLPWQSRAPPQHLQA